MPKSFAVGDRVTVLPPFDGDALLVSLQPHATVAEVLRGPGSDAAVYMLQLAGTMPREARFGPFPATRLVLGWDDAAGRRA